MATLKTNYKDDILDTSQNTKRKYRMTENQDGTVSLDDETVYTQEGDSFGASDMNATNGKVNALETDIGEINDNLSGFKFYPIGTQLVALVADDSFYTDANGKYVLASSTTGQSIIDNVTYKALASTEETHGEVGADTCSPFKGKINTYGYGGVHGSVNHLYEYEGINFDVLYVHSCDVNGSSQSQRAKTWRRGENPTFTLEYYNATTNKYGTWTINVVSKNKFTYSLSTTDTSYVQSYGAHFDFSVAGY